MANANNGWALLYHHQSGFPDIDETATLEALPPEILRGRRPQVKIEPAGGDLEDADWGALQRQQAELFQTQHLGELRDEGLGIVYFGNTRIPLALDLGYRTESWVPIRFFLYDRVNKSWQWQGKADDSAPLEVICDDDALPRRQLETAGEVIVRVGVTTPISPKDTHELVPNAQAEIDIHLGDRCGNHALQAPEDFEAVAQAFLDALNRIHGRLPNTTRIHLFAAVPAGLAFRMGTLINHSVHPVIQTYQYEKNARPRYQPALALGAEAPIDMTLKIQFLSAQPSRLDPLRVDKEHREIRAQLRDGDQRDRFEELLETRMAARAVDMQKYIRRDKAHIIHFSGHGEPGGFLCFEDAVGEVEHVAPDIFRAMVELWNEDDRIQCVVLNACYSNMVAETLTRAPAVVRCAIGTTTAVTDDAAIAFCVGFYSALADGVVVDKAFQAGKLQVLQTSRGEVDFFQLFVGDDSVREKPLFRR